MYAQELLAWLLRRIAAVVGKLPQLQYNKVGSPSWRMLCMSFILDKDGCAEEVKQAGQLWGCRLEMSGDRPRLIAADGQLLELNSRDAPEEAVLGQALLHFFSCYKDSNMQEFDSLAAYDLLTATDVATYLSTLTVHLYLDFPGKSMQPPHLRCTNTM